MAIKGYLNRSAPGYLIFFVTPVCDCRCKMCFYLDAIENAKNRKVLTLDEIRRFAQNFPGLHQVNFSGGEPFLRDDFSEIPELFYRYSGTRGFTCPTNSSHPDRIEEGVRRICMTCPEGWVRISQSVDAVGEKHDAIRRKNGLFEKVLETNRRLERLSRDLPNLSVSISTVFSYYNQEDAYELLDFVYENLAFSDYGVGFVRGDVKDPQAKDVEIKSYLAFQKEALRRPRRGGRGDLASRVFTAVNRTVRHYVMRTIEEDRYLLPCQAGRRMVVVDDEGRVLPCEILGEKIRQGASRLDSPVLGNLREFDYDIRKVLAGDRAQRAVKDIVTSKCYCTFECAWAVNVIYTPAAWPRIVANLF